MKKTSFFSFILFILSVFLHLILLFSFSIYFLNSRPQSSPVKYIIPIAPVVPIVLPKEKPIQIVVKEKNLIDIDFNVRLLELGAKVGHPVFIRIFKKESMLEVWIKPNHEFLLFKQYPICAYSGYLGPKLKEGDKQSPEGFYKVTKRLLNPNSRFYLAFNLGFPNTYDKAHKRTGSYLMVHGACASIGCYAMTNSKIEEIYKLVDKALRKGKKYVQVHAFPFRMTDTNMAKYADNKWYNFWTELKEGYDYFEVEHLPPYVDVQNKHYIIHESR